MSAGRIVDGRYRTEQLLGRGGVGEVYRARDLRLDRPVALKIVPAEQLGGPEGQRRFLRDVQVVSTLHHPSIVATLDHGTLAGGGAYLVMELVHGEDLRSVLRRERRIESPRAMRILAAVCSAVEAAHRVGVLHRDLKPENILLENGSGEAKVLDFGVAMGSTQHSDDEPLEISDGSSMLAAAGMIVGTPAYMAPEQLRGVQPDARTDVFSLGVIAYEMLSGELPFGRGSLAEIVLAQARGVRPLPGSPVRQSVDVAIRTALNPDPDRRPASPQAFAHLLAASIGM